MIQDSDVTLAARTAYEAVRAYRRQIGMADMLPWIDAGNLTQTAYEQAVTDLRKNRQHPMATNIEAFLINAVDTALIEWRKANGDSTGTGR